MVDLVIPPLAFDVAILVRGVWLFRSVDFLDWPAMGIATASQQQQQEARFKIKGTKIKLELQVVGRDPSMETS
eukprot:353489-Pyramimonas_sp.AAC.1